MDNPTLPDTRTRFPDWLFWLSWVVASTAAIFLGFGMMYAAIFIAKAVFPGVNEDRLFGGLMLPLLATALGVAQWFVLRRRLARSGWWILATGAGMLIGMALGGGAVRAISQITGQQWNWDFQPGLLVLYVFIGFSLTLAQLPVLWRHFTGFAVWLLAGIVGWAALGLVMGKSIDRMTDVLALGAVPAVFTGLGLIWLMRAPRGQSARPA